MNTEKLSSENENGNNANTVLAPVLIEEPYFDKNGKQIKEFAVLKVYHFKGVNEQGKGRKHYYMYKWVKLKEWKGKKYWVAQHLSKDDPDSYYHLRSVANKETRIIADTEIVQQF